MEDHGETSLEDVDGKGRRESGEQLGVLRPLNRMVSLYYESGGGTWHLPDAEQELLPSPCCEE